MNEPKTKAYGKRDRWLFYRMRCHEDALRFLAENLLLSGFSERLLNELRLILDNGSKKIPPNEFPPDKRDPDDCELPVTFGCNEVKEGMKCP